MKLAEIFRFEFGYQVRRLSTWIPFVLLVLVAFLIVRNAFLADALYAEFYLNAPFVIAAATVIGTLFWLVTAAVVTGEIGARDMESGMHPLAYTAPVSRAEYLGGRFLAAFALHALILLATPLGILAAMYLPGVEAALVGPFRPAAYLTAYAFLALPNAFVGTAIQFAAATLGRRSIASYIGSVVLLLVAYGGIFAVMYFLERQDLAALLDVFGHLFLTSDLVLGWTPIEKNTRLIELKGALLHSRLLWLGIALGTLLFTYLRFRFGHHTTSAWWTRAPRVLGIFADRRADAHAPPPSAGDLARATPLATPRVPRTFGLATSARQTLEIARDSFATIATSRGGLILLAAIAAVAVMVLPENMTNMGTPLLPRTEFVLTLLTARLTSVMTPWVVIPLLIILWAGELVWREREAGLGEITDAAPVPDWALFTGRFLGLALILCVWMALLTAVGILVQLGMGYHIFELGLYLQVLFGLQLPEYLLFAVLALLIQGVANQKYVGHLAALIGYGTILFASRLGLQHHLLVYGSAPGWSYTDMRGFGPSLGPWRWFMLYWAAWALLLVVVARLLWVRGLERGLGVRLDLARRRFTRPTARAAAAAAGLVAVLGGFIFYNTNVRNEYLTASDILERRAEYERRYGRYAEVPQPELTDTKLQVDIHPERRELEIRGSYRLVNRTAHAIDSIHLAPSPGVRTGGFGFDRTATLVVADEEHGHRIYALEEPLRPGDSLSVSFEVNSRPRGFRNGGVDPAVTENSTYFKNDRLPGIGYQATRELIKPGERRRYGLTARPLIPLLADAAAGQDITGEAPLDLREARRTTIEALVSTARDQVAIGPGALRRSWTEGDRRYFHYATDAPIGNEYAFFSARYAVHEEEWIGPAAPLPGRDAIASSRTPSPDSLAAPAPGGEQRVKIEVFYHPRHAANLQRMLHSVRASLEHNSREYGPYPYGHVRLVENPGQGMGAHADASTIDYTEGFTRFSPEDDPSRPDLPFAVMAHEMAHQWGVPYAFVEGAPLLSESFAWYAAMGVVEETYGRDQLERLRRFFRQPHPIPPIRQSVPLIRALDPYAAYRKGPFALYAMSEYIGAERVNLAFRRLREAHWSGAAPQTTLDLYRELQAVTPDSLRYLLHDLFMANTFWELETRRAAATPTGEGAWQVRMDLRARKVTVDEAGAEREVPMDEWVQIGVFAPTEQGAEFGETLYLQKHRIRSGEQSITVTVPEEPSDAGIDPYHLLIELERFDNVEEVEIEN